MAKKIHHINENSHVLELPVTQKHRTSHTEEIWVSGSRVYVEDNKVKVDFREGIKHTKYKPMEEMRKITKAILYLKGKYLYGRWP